MNSFHIRGSCRDGEWCQFSHDTNQSVPIPETVCWYYLQSHCMYGENCRSVHIIIAINAINGYSILPLIKPLIHF